MILANPMVFNFLVPQKPQVDKNNSSRTGLRSPNVMMYLTFAQFMKHVECQEMLTIICILFRIFNAFLLFQS